MKAGEGTMIAYRVIRDSIPHLASDRILSKDISTMIHLIRSGKIIEAVEKKIGKLR